MIDSKGLEYRVTQVDPGVYKRPWLRGNPKKKNGEFGITERHIYSWVLKQEEG